MTRITVIGKAKREGVVADALVCCLFSLSQIDVFFDNVGGFTSEAFFDCVRKFARVAICGQIASYNSGAHPQITSPFGKIIYTSVSIRGFVVFDYLSRWAEFLQAMTPLVKEGKIHYEETIVRCNTHTATAEGSSSVADSRPRLCLPPCDLTVCAAPRCRDFVQVEGFEKLPSALRGLFEGANVGKMVVKI